MSSELMPLRTEQPALPGMTEPGRRSQEMQWGVRRPSWLGGGVDRAADEGHARCIQRHNAGCVAVQRQVITYTGPWMEADRA